MDFAFLGTASVYEVLSEQEISEVVWQTVELFRMTKSRSEDREGRRLIKECLNDCINNVLTLAVSKGAVDNISGVIVFFKSVLERLRGQPNEDEIDTSFDSGEEDLDLYREIQRLKDQAKKLRRLRKKAGANKEPLEAPKSSIMNEMERYKSLDRKWRRRFNQEGGYFGKKVDPWDGESARYSTNQRVVVAKRKIGTKDAV